MIISKAVALSIDRLVAVLLLVWRSLNCSSTCCYDAAISEGFQGSGVY